MYVMKVFTRPFKERSRHSTTWIEINISKNKEPHKGVAGETNVRCNLL